MLAGSGPGDEARILTEFGAAGVGAECMALCPLAVISAGCNLCRRACWRCGRGDGCCAVAGEGAGWVLGWRWVGVIGATVEPALPLVVYANPYADDYQAGESLLSWSPFLQ